MVLAAAPLAACTWPTGHLDVTLVATVELGTRCRVFLQVDNTTAERLEELTVTLTWVQAGRAFDGRFLDRALTVRFADVRADAAVTREAETNLPDPCPSYGALPGFAIDGCLLRHQTERACIARVRFADLRPGDDPSLRFAVPE